MKKVLKNTLKTKKYLDSLPKIYLISFCALYVILDFPFSVKYVKENGIDIPLVYDYDDHNGTCDYWWLRKITNTTTGYKLVWTQNAAAARKISDKMNEDF